MIDPTWRPPVLTGERLWLRPLDERDADSLFAAASNRNVTKYTLWEAHQSRDDALEFLRTYVAEHYREGVPDPLGIVLRGDPHPTLPHPWGEGGAGGPVVGCVGCRWASEKNRTMEFGYWIAEPFWGRGLVVEGARLLIDHVFRSDLMVYSLAINAVLFGASFAIFLALLRSAKHLGSLLGSGE